MKNELEKRNLIAKWFLVIATLAVLITLLASIPALNGLTDSFLTKDIEQKLVLVCIFFMPLAAIFILIPLVKLQNRSIFVWGISFVLFPLGAVIWGWVLYALTKRKLAGEKS